MSEAIVFVNIFGERVYVNTTKRVKRPKRESRTPEKFHKGWRVVGVSPQAIADAERKRKQDIQKAIAHNDDIDAGKTHFAIKRQVPLPFNREAWVEIAPLRPARSTPFEIEACAHQCAELARAAGWQRVEIRRLAKGVA